MLKLTNLTEKNMKTILLITALLFSLASNAYANKSEAAEDVKKQVLEPQQQCHQFLNFKATKLRVSEQVDFCQSFKGKALLIVNTASKCGYTPQFKGLEQLHQQYGERLAVIGFPSNDFRQEHNTSEQVAEVCYVNYGVTFTMLESSNVSGLNANVLFKRLSKKTGQAPSWNFGKYLVSNNGESVEYFAPKVKPKDKRLIKAIESIL